MIDDLRSSCHAAESRRDRAHGAGKTTLSRMIAAREAAAAKSGSRETVQLANVDQSATC